MHARQSGKRKAKAKKAKKNSKDTSSVDIDDL